MIHEAPVLAAGLVLLAAAALLCLSQRRTALALGLGWLGAVLALTASTLERSDGQGAQHACALLAKLTLAAGAAALGLGAAAGAAAWLGRFWAAAKTGSVAAVGVAALVALYAQPGLRPIPPTTLAEPASDRAALWVQAIAAYGRAAAAGSPQAALRAAALAADRGADVTSLALLCPKALPPRLVPRGEDETFGLSVCQAVRHPLPEVGAATLACTARAAAGPPRLHHRCRVAAELWAATGDLEAAAQAFVAASHVGQLAAQGLWHTLGLVWPHAPAGPGGQTAAEPAPIPGTWPDPRTISPQALGWQVLDVPGQLAWHPGSLGAPAPGGVLSARSPYRSALTTRVPVPVPRPTAVRLRVLGQPGLALTFAGATGAHTYRCAPVGAQTPGPNHLPAAACQERWVEVLLEPPVGEGGIEVARISGEFLLAAWHWQGPLRQGLLGGPS